MKGKPFEPGNRMGRGRPRGSRNKKTGLCRKLLEDNAELLTRKLIVMAAHGDRTAMRMCMDRLYPSRRSQPVSFRLPAVSTPQDLLPASQALLNCISRGEVTPEDADKVGHMIELHRKAMVTAELEQRIQALEAGVKGLPS